MKHSRPKCALVCWLALFALAMIDNAWAHDPGLSAASITLRPRQCDIDLGFSVTDARIIAGSISGRNETINPKKIIATLEPVVEQSVEIRFANVVLRPKQVRCSTDGNNISIHLEFPPVSSGALSFRSKWILLLPPGHREYVSVQKPNGEVVTEGMLSAGSDSIATELTDEHSTADVYANSFVQFVTMGIKHIWTGYDHLLFLFGLLAVTRNVKSVLRITTCFTVARSITLAVATLNLLRISPRVVEPLIAASIVFVGVENFLCRGEPKGRCLLTFAFGLVHGFGFASALRETGVGIHGGVALPLLSFNLGVEIGQIAIAAIALPLIWKLKSQPAIVRAWNPATAGLITVAGAFWLFQRI